jgi:shikimate dehydrogenase
MRHGDARFGGRVSMGSPTETIDAATRCCAVYGHPIRQSASPAMHNAAFAALGLNWRYLAFDVAPDELRAALDGAAAMGFAGVNLTVPHKLLAVGIVNELAPCAREWGAVNTVRFEVRGGNGDWLPASRWTDETGEAPVRAQGFNTDADAISRALREDLGVAPAGARVCLLGAGGAGRVAALKLAAERVEELWLVNRTVSKAESLAAEIRSRYPHVRVGLGYPRERIDVLINATSLGLRGANDPLPCDPQALDLERVGAVYDMIYRPPTTPLLERARACGCRVANGLSMLLYQGARAFELWTGQAAPLEVMRAALDRAVDAAGAERAKR